MQVRVLPCPPIFSETLDSLNLFSLLYLVRNPWKKLLRYVKESGRVSLITKKRPTAKVYISWEDLQDLFYKQNGRCYWFNIPLNPDDIFKTYYPLAMSVDRLNPDGEYSKNNIVICCRFANVGRGRYPAKEFKELVKMISIGRVDESRTADANESKSFVLGSASLSTATIL